MTPPQKISSPEEALHLTITLASESIRNGGGPFAALIVDQENRIVSTGVNNSVKDRDPTSHAEICAIRACCRIAKSHNAAEALGAELSLYSSSEPCIMCFGAIWWANFRRVYWAASAKDAEAIGFEEGPVSPQLWQELTAAKGTEVFPEFAHADEARKVLRSYREQGGIIY